MYNLKEKLTEYKNNHQDKPKEKIQLQTIEGIAPKITPKVEAKILFQQPQKEQDNFIRNFSINNYLSDIKLPPQNIPWIEYLLKWKPKPKQYEILKQYKALYWEAYNKAQLENQKVNAGTLKANTWLRVLVTGE